MTPYDGAVAFIAALCRHGSVTLVTDSFDPMNTALIAAFEVDRVLRHRFIPDARGFIGRCAYWNGLAGKQLCLAGIEGATVAIGDAFNDLPLLRAATCGILFRPSLETGRAGENFRVATTYADVIVTFATQQRINFTDPSEFEKERSSVQVYRLGGSRPSTMLAASDCEVFASRLILPG